MITLGTDLVVKRDHPLPGRSTQSGGDFRKTNGQLPVKAVDATRVLAAMEQKRWTPASGLGDQGEEVAPGLCVLELDWKGCLWLGKNFESREPKRAKSVAQGKGSRDCLYAPGIKEGVGGLAFLCFAMTQTCSGIRGTFDSAPAAFLLTCDGQGSDPAKILSPTKPLRTGWAPFRSLLTNTRASSPNSFTLSSVFGHRQAQHHNQ